MHGVRAVNEVVRTDDEFDKIGDLRLKGAHQPAKVREAGELAGMRPDLPSRRRIGAVVQREQKCLRQIDVTAVGA